MTSFRDRLTRLFDDCAHFEIMEIADVLNFAGNQKIQTDLPLATRRLWIFVAHRWPGLTALGAWGDRSHKARKSCHNSGRAIDLMTTNVAMHKVIVAYFLIHHKEHEVTLIISRGEYASAKTGWKMKPYPRRFVMPHNDHVHLSVNC